MTEKDGNTPPIASKNIIPAKVIWRLMRDATGGRAVSAGGVAVLTEYLNSYSQRFIMSVAARAAELQAERNELRAKQNIPVEKRLSAALIKEVLNIV